MPSHIEIVSRGRVSNGFYEATWRRKTWAPGKTKTSTFFPDTMSKERVKNFIRATSLDASIKGKKQYIRTFRVLPKGINIKVVKGKRGWHGHPRID